MTSNRPRVRDDLALREGYHSPQLDVEVRLNTNEAPAPPPQAFTRQVMEAVEAVRWNRYPDRTASELRAAIGERYDRTAAEVFVANGSNEVLQTLLLAFGGPGRCAAVFEPTYALHSHIARTTGTEVVEGRRRDDFSLDLDEVQRVIDEADPDVVFLCSPNNPSGLVDPPHTVSEVLAMVEGRRTLLVMDEAYGQFAPTSAVGLIAEDVPLVVTRTFSKTWSMAAARLGYLLGPRWLVQELENVILPYHLDAMKQAAGLAALGFSDDMNARVAQVIEERGRLLEAFQDLPVTTWPSQASFFLFRPDDRDGNEVWQELVDRSILLRNCASWPGLDGCLRVTIGTPEENDRLLDALRDILL
ncbi:MAG: histidinol-phosphate transaminase [Acidimicrobiales bacterium]|nr:histidinol-phosphate transaminase [Acidimicrobiales bacterium]